MAFDIRVAETGIENMLRDAVLYALGRRLAAVADVSGLRAVKTQGASSSVRHADVLIPIVSSGAVVNSYRWTPGATNADDGVNWVKPDDVAGAGRWHRWTSTLRFQPVVGGNAYNLHQLAAEVQGPSVGPIERVILLDKSMTEEEINQFIFGQTPSVLIESMGDDPEDMTQDVGESWRVQYKLNISVVSQNLHDRREAAQGSIVPSDKDPGANAIDGAIMALLVGTGLYFENDSIRAVRAGACSNWISDMGQRRVIRSRKYTVQADVLNPPAPNDADAAQEVDYQSEMTQLDAAGDAPFDPNNYIISGCNVLLGDSLTQDIAAGSVLLANATVIYAGESGHVFSANRSTYRDLDASGLMHFIEANLGDEAPPVTAGAMRIGVTITDASTVVSDQYLAQLRMPYMNPFVAELD